MHPACETPAGQIALRGDEAATPAPAGPKASVARFTGAHAIAVLVVCALAAFLPVRENGFVSYDDRRNFLENPSFRGLGRPQLVWAWTTPHVGV
jgi:hypothetical protein